MITLIVWSSVCLTLKALPWTSFHSPCQPPRLPSPLSDSQHCLPKPCPATSLWQQDVAWHQAYQQAFHRQRPSHPLILTLARDQDLAWQATPGAFGPLASALRPFNLRHRLCLAQSAIYSFT
ncbi:hypothetical protein QC763_300005 [Podospora pseudopauciseta]|uniref:Uncharacterized protein n=1 Tax=Podospora pseudopauciseta TaxID=2093780 RepID=A0ABR0HEB7_9PEZI|nr:hypothetical protein QC763_300005 [Podospora pseudopauciseta]